MFQKNIVFFLNWIVVDSVSLLTDKFLAGCLSTTRFWRGIAALTENFHGIARLTSDGSIGEVDSCTRKIYHFFEDEPLDDGYGLKNVNIPKNDRKIKSSK